MTTKLIIGNKNYSTWSLRPWLLLSAFDLPFDEVTESLQPDRLRARLLTHSPAGKVPVLVDADVLVWDSLAICEYVSEVHLAGQGWPRNAPDRAKARAICCEMHAGFTALRAALPGVRCYVVEPAGAAVLAAVAAGETEEAAGRLMAPHKIQGGGYSMPALRQLGGIATGTAPEQGHPYADSASTRTTGGMSTSPPLCAEVSSSSHQSAASASVSEVMLQSGGFVCPECMADFRSSAGLTAHYEELHLLDYGSDNSDEMAV